MSNTVQGTEFFGEGGRSAGREGNKDSRAE
jgi:hypothetical protein